MITFTELLERIDSFEYDIDTNYVEKILSEDFEELTEANIAAIFKKYGNKAGGFGAMRGYHEIDATKKYAEHMYHYGVVRANLKNMDFGQRRDAEELLGKIQSRMDRMAKHPNFDARGVPEMRKKIELLNKEQEAK